MHAPRRAPHWRNTRPGQNIQQRCHPDFVGIQSLASISSREEYKAWPAYPPEVSPRHWRNTRPGQLFLAEVSPRQSRNTRPGQHMQRRCHPDTGGIQGLARCHPDVGGTQGQASISNRGVTQTLEGYKAWPAYPAEMPSRHWRNTRPGQNIKQRHHPDIGGIQCLASISSRGATQTSQEYLAWPAYPADASPRHQRYTRPAADS